MSDLHDGLPLANVKANTITMVFKRFVEPALIVAYLWVLVRLHGHAFNGDYWVLAIMAFFLSSYFFTEFHERRLRRNPKGPSIISPVLDWLAVAAVLVVVAYICEFYQQFSLRAIFFWVVTTPVGLIISQQLQSRVMRDLHSKGEVRKAIIIGVNPAALKLADRVEKYPSLMIKLMGFFDDRELNRQPAGTFTPLHGKMSDVAAYVRENNINMVYISMPISAQPRVLQMIDELQDTTASIYFIPDIYIFNLIQARFDYVGGMAVMAICETPFTGTNNIVKRISDLVLASGILLMLLPVMMVIALCVKLTSPGPIIFKQRRYGLDGEEIVVYKFRSMTVMEDGGKVTQATKGDMRLTKIGGFLRSSSLDELPQFFNVLQGRMSIVGPRPHAVAHNELYRKQIKGYMLRHKVKPGITGWAQVNGLRGETETLDKMKARIEFDLEYLRRWSLMFDLWIIFQTVRMVIKRDNAYGWTRPSRRGGATSTGRGGRQQVTRKRRELGQMKIGKATVSWQHNVAAKALVSAMLLVALAACGEKKTASGSSQVVAIVDGQEITIHQVNNELAKTGGTQVTKQLLDGLVARQLMINAAKKDKLDNDPAVVADMERARNLVLAQSYVAGKLKAPVRPADQEIDDFYRKNPDWFAQRKQYEFAQLIIARTSLTPELNALMDQPGKRLDDVVGWLDSHRVQYARQQVVKTSADLPQQMNASLKTMERGTMFVVIEGPTAILTSLQDVKNVPMTLAVASPQIAQYLVTLQQNQASEQLVERLKKDAKIELTEQAKSFKDLNAAAPVDKDGAAAQGSPGKDAASADSEAIKRGVAGFK